MPKKLYEILEITDENISGAEIAKAYRKMALRLHPDKNTENKQEAEQKFKELNNAYQILKDATKRKEYDEGRIDEKGVRIESQASAQASQQQQQQQRQRPSQQNRQYDFPKTQTQESKTHSFQKTNNKYNFYRPTPPFPAEYFFFNSLDAAKTFKPMEEKSIPQFVFVTPSPLEQFFQKLLRVFNKESQLEHQIFKSSTNIDFEFSSRHIKPQNNVSEHIFIRTNYAPIMERTVDKLFALALIVEQLDRLESSPFSSPSPRFR
ncbi:J domain-containing protein [Legionella worsleiensis]|uniref:J domain-containing protein n=1 Tax=Legionella worsleiensis TaxID=45076 RepID=UPI0039E84621